MAGCVLAHFNFETAQVSTCYPPAPLMPPPLQCRYDSCRKLLLVPHARLVEVYRSGGVEGIASKPYLPMSALLLIFVLHRCSALIHLPELSIVLPYKDDSKFGHDDCTVGWLHTTTRQWAANCTVDMFSRGQLGEAVPLPTPHTLSGPRPCHSSREPRHAND